MKKIIAVSFVTLMLSGCALIDAYLMAGYDTTEYALINRIKTQSELYVEDCKDANKSKQNADNLYATAVELKNFSTNIPRNEDTTKLAINLVDLTKQGKEQYVKNSNVSETFCKLKLQQIGRSAEVAQKVIGKKPR
jgi:uncharacterized protein YcbK (DUF882 family)